MNPSSSTRHAPTLDKRYENTRFDSPHSDDSGYADWFFTAPGVGIYLTRAERAEYFQYGRYFESFLG